LTSSWTVTELLPKPKQGGGIVVLQGIAKNQEDVTVAEAVGKILVANRPGQT
jgi:acyl dehydratase